MTLDLDAIAAAYSPHVCPSCRRAGTRPCSCDGQDLRAEVVVPALVARVRELEAERDEARAEMERVSVRAARLSVSLGISIEALERGADAGSELACEALRRIGEVRS